MIYTKKNIKNLSELAQKFIRYNDYNRYEYFTNNEFDSIISEIESKKLTEKDLIEKKYIGI